jgi:hypothetical protein
MTFLWGFFFVFIKMRKTLVLHYQQVYIVSSIFHQVLIAPIVSRGILALDYGECK